MNRVELLSPAGDLKIFKGVVNAGADAVYFGGDLFGARAYAKNFSIDESASAINYAHHRGVKAYLTVNTLLKNLEIEKDLYSYLKAYVENGIDAFIVQDRGVFEFIKTFFPNVDIHASTQMTLCSKYGAKHLQDLGASRIVTARELSIEEISKIHELCPDLEIESFVHGALCVCYSGQCLMSSIIGGRSGNRGRCAQPCRLPYKGYFENGKKMDFPGEYILSPKDFCTIQSLPELIEAGVYSLKIEGRMKQFEYAAGVVSMYRKYLDEYLYHGSRNYNVSPEDMNKLMDYGNRSGFTDLYLSKNNGKDLITFEEPSHSKNSQIKSLDIPEKKLPINCKIKACVGEPLEICFYNEDEKATFTGEIIEKASKKATTAEDIKKSIGQLGNTDFSLDRFIIDLDEDAFVPASWLKNGRREALSLYENLVFISNDVCVNPYSELKLNTNKKNNQSVFVSVENLEQYDVVKDFEFVDTICVPDSIFDEVYKANGNKKKLIYKMPAILREYTSFSINDMADGVLASTYDSLGYLESINYPKDKVIIDQKLYSFSNRAIDGFNKDGYKINCIPYELSLKELYHRNNSDSQMILYSRIPLMITANCGIKNSKGCTKQNELYFIKDRKDASFPVKCSCSDVCCNTIYNSKVYCAFSEKDSIAKLNVKEYRLDFTIEDKKETLEVLKSFEDVFIKNMPYVSFADSTKGHLKRGVE